MKNLSPALREKLYGPALRIVREPAEEFARDPFRFFVGSGLRRDERKVFETGRPDRGQFQHTAKNISRTMMAEGKRWTRHQPAEARERIGKIAAAQTEHFRRRAVP